MSGTTEGDDINHRGQGHGMTTDTLNDRIGRALGTILVTQSIEDWSNQGDAGDDWTEVPQRRGAARAQDGL